MGGVEGNLYQAWAVQEGSLSQHHHRPTLSKQQQKQQQQQLPPQQKQEQQQPSRGLQHLKKTTTTRTTARTTTATTTTTLSSTQGTIRPPSISSVKRSVSSVFYFCDAHTVKITFEEFYLASKKMKKNFLSCYSSATLCDKCT